MKKEDLEGRMSFHVNDDFVSIELFDYSSSIEFLEIKMAHKEFLECLRGRGDAKFTYTAKGLDRLGMDLEVRSTNVDYTVLGPRQYRDEDWHDRLKKHVDAWVAENHEGWIASHYFDQQGQFFKEDGRLLVRVTIRRWVEKQENE